MQSAGEAGELFALLEGGAAGAGDASRALLGLLGAVREPWPVRGLLAYHAATGSARALDLLARAPEHHHAHLVDALRDRMRQDPGARHHALAALAALAARRPAALLRPAAPCLALLGDAVRAARTEHAAAPRLHALLALAALVPAAPALAAPHWPDLCEALLRPDAGPPGARPHLRLARQALFHALYATHPCTLLDQLRAELAAPGRAPHADRDLAPLLRSVRLHPALLSGSRAREADAARWARVELHDVLADCRRLALPARGRAASADPAPPSPAPTPAPAPAEPAPGSARRGALLAAALRPGSETWAPLAERCGADSAPHTPLPAEAEAGGGGAGGEPPEAAVEATPENTPAKESRAQFRFPGEGGAARALSAHAALAGPSPPAGPAPGPAPGDAYSARVSRVLEERRAAESPVTFGGAPSAWGAGVARPEPSRPRPRAAPLASPAPPHDPEDREVRELTRAQAGPAQPRDPRRARAAWRDTRASAPAPACRTPPGPRPRPRSWCAGECGARGRSGRAEAGAQTVDAWPEPYEFLVADLSRQLADATLAQDEDDDEEPECGGAPAERLDRYLERLYAGSDGQLGPAGATRAELGEQLALLHAQLQYERWRRDAHAERSRRLLGRCRQARDTELAAAALRDRVRDLATERDELAARLAALRAHQAAPALALAPAPAQPRAEREEALEAELAEERAARARAELRLREAEAARAADAGELARARGAAAEAARRADLLARGAAAAERRGEHVRRLRRELLVLAEREARLEAAGAGGGAAAAALAAEACARAGETRALRAALGRAEAESGSAHTRAEAAVARTHELEALVVSRDAVVCELRRSVRRAAEEHEARAQALHDKYRAVVRVLRAADERRLERTADAELASASAGAGAGAGAEAGARAS